MCGKLSVLCCGSFFEESSFSVWGPQVRVARGSVVSVRFLCEPRVKKIQSFTGICLFYRKTSGYLGLYVILGRIPVLLYIPTKSPFFSSVEVR